MTSTSAQMAEAVLWRRHLHAHPELSFEEHKTAAFVEERLRSFGLEPERPTPTSVVARLRNGAGRTIALRADMDALPIHEESGVEFASTCAGIMHACCGHDMHTATLLAVARTLVAMRDELAGEVRFVFQHAEEMPPGGASQLIAAGVVDGCDTVLGCHVFAEEPVGSVAVPVGPFMAAPDFFTIRVRGRGGHAAMPHRAIDPVVCAAQIVTGLQSVVSREVNSISPAVVSVTTIHGGTAKNIIPEVVELSGTVRTFAEDMRSQIREAMGRIASALAAAGRCEAEFVFEEGYAATVNDADIAALVTRNVPPDRLHEIDPTLGGEDFSAYAAVAPACFFIVGAGGPESFPHHHPRFVVDEAAMPVAHDVFVATTRDFLRP